MYIEASSPRRYKDNALLYSIYYPGSSKGNCFNFWYHMYGAHIGALNVYLNTGKSTPIWNKTDDQGNVWRHGRVTVRSRSRFRVSDSELSHFALAHFKVMFTSSPPEVFLGRRILKMCCKFIGEHPCRSAN